MPTHRLKTIHSACLALFILAAGCAGIGRQLQPPNITLVNLAVREITLFEAAFEVQLRVINPNDASISVKSMECDLNLFGKHIASGVVNAEAQIPAYGSVVIPVAVYSSMFDVIQGLSALKDEENLSYSISGRLRLAKGIMALPTIPFKSEGKLPIGAFKKALK